MNINRFLKELKKEGNYVAATTLIHRVEAVREVEELTGRPIPKENMAKRADTYYIRTEEDAQIRARKRAIANELFNIEK